MTTSPPTAVRDRRRRPIPLSPSLALLALLPAGASLAQAPPPAPPAATLEVVYTGEVMGTVRGGSARDAAYLDNLDLKLLLDGARLLDWRGAILFAYVLSNRGDNPSAFAGDAQGVSNIAAPNAWRLYELWLQQNLANGRVSLLGGLYDLNTEFDVIQSAGLFLNSSFGIGPDYSQSGENGPSIFPSTSLGLRVKVRPRPSFYAEVAVLDAVPGDPDDPKATAVSLSSREGALLAAEVAFFQGASTQPDPLTTRPGARNRSRRIGRGQEAARYDGKIALGGWWYTSDFAVIEAEVPGIPARSASYGVYVLGERTLYREADGHEGLTLFSRLGLARARVNRFASYVGAGAVYAGLLPGRADDEVGIGLAFANNGDPYLRLALGNGDADDRTEGVVEVTYRAQLLPWFAMQPDLQWILNPDTRAGRANALVLGMRAELAMKFQ